MKSYKHSNGRIVHRSSNGTFRKTTLADFGIAPHNMQDGHAICANCGYGSEERWYPVLKTGYCPKCGSQEKKEEFIFPAPLQKKIDGMNKDDMQRTISLLESLMGSIIPPSALDELIKEELVYGNKILEELYKTLKERVSKS